MPPGRSAPSAAGRLTGPCRPARPPPLSRPAARPPRSSRSATRAPPSSRPAARPPPLSRPAASPPRSSRSAARPSRSSPSAVRTEQLPPARPIPDPAAAERRLADERDHLEHRALVRQPGHRNRLPGAAHRCHGARHHGEQAGPATRAAQVRGHRAAPQPLAAGRRLPRRARGDGHRRPVRHHRARRHGDPACLAVPPAVDRPGRGLARPDDRADHDQPGPGPDRPQALARRALAGLRGLAGRARAQHRQQRRPAERPAARPHRRVCACGGRRGRLAGAAGHQGAAPRGTGRRRLLQPGRCPVIGRGTGLTIASSPRPGDPVLDGDQRAQLLPRLLPADGRPAGLPAHLAVHGPLPYRGRPGPLIAEVRESGLTGRGGAAFPVHRKLAAVAAAGRRPVVVANGAESEPLSAKDKTLLHYSPHLVLDGLQLAAEAVGARRTVLYLHEDTALQAWLGELLWERQSNGLDRAGVDLVLAPPRFLSGQETAVVNVLNGGPALPTFTPPRTFERGVGGAPTLVQNIETLAHLALVARYLALESAGQCGPCLNGLPRIATALAELAGTSPGNLVINDLERWGGLTSGRGACHHPDGAVRFVRSALRVFAPEIRRHQAGTCTATDGRPFLPAPAGPAGAADWRRRP